MEEHRLVDMPKNYDRELFNRLYSETENLRRKLAYNIDHNRYGVEKEDIMSWLTVKFIFIFTKYYNEVPENILKAKIIQGLQFYKNRILKYSYTKKNQVNNTEDISELYDIKAEEIDVVTSMDDPKFTVVAEYFRKNLDPLAYVIFTIDYNPPLYLLTILGSEGTTRGIPEKYICKFLGVSYKKNHQFITEAKKRYKKLVNKVKKSKAIQLEYAD